MMFHVKQRRASNGNQILVKNTRVFEEYGVSIEKRLSSQKVRGETFFIHSAVFFGTAMGSSGCTSGSFG